MGLLGKILGPPLSKESKEILRDLPRSKPATGSRMLHGELTENSRRPAGRLRMGAPAQQTDAPRRDPEAARTSGEAPRRQRSRGRGSSR